MSSKNRTLYIWWLSYMAVLLLCFISGLFVYAHMLGTVEKEVKRTSNATIGRFSNHIEARMADMVTAARTLAVSDRAAALMKLTAKRFSAKEMESLFYCQQLLITTLNSSSEFSSLFIYYPGIDILLTNQELFRDAKIDKAAASYALTTKELEEYCRSSGFTKFYPLKNGSLMLLHRFTGRGGGAMLIGLELSFADLSDSVLSYMPNHSLLLARFNDQIMQIGTLQLDVNQISDQIFLSSDHDLVSLEEEKLTAVVFQSDYTGVEYAYLVPTNEYYSEVISLRWLFAVYASLMLLLGGVVAWLLARKNYRPIRRVANMLIARAASNADEDAVLLIERKIRDLIKESDKKEIQQFKADRIYKNDLMMRLLTGRVMGLTERNLLSCGIDARGSVAVAALRIEEYGDLFGTKQKDHTEEESVLLHAVKNVTEEFAAKVCPTSVQVFDDVIYCISSLDKCRLDSFRDAIGYVLEFVRENLHVILSAGISCEHEGLPSIREAAVEAFGTMEYLALNKTTNKVGLFEALANEPALSLSQTGFFEKLSLISNLTLAGEYTAALSAIASASTYCKDVHTARNRVQSIALAVCDAVESLLHSRETEANAILQEARLFANVRTFKDLQCGAERIYGMLSEESLTRLEDKEDAMIAYFDNHITDPSLSVGSIADHFHMSQSTLTRTMSRLTGRNPLDYIQIKRLALAKELLSMGSTIAEATEKCGCYNELALKRIFKKYEGVTPAAYREAAKSLTVTAPLMNSDEF